MDQLTLIYRLEYGVGPPNRYLGANVWEGPAPGWKCGMIDDLRGSS